MFKLFRLTIDAIQWRICLRILNEAARCLEENILHSPVCSVEVYFCQQNRVSFF